MAQDIQNNCGYWLYLGENDVPKAEGSIKPIATGSDSGSYDLSGRPVLDFDAQPLSTEEYKSGSKSIPRILTRAEKGQALTHLEMDFNLASLLHKANTSSVASTFASNEDAMASDPEDPAEVPYIKVPAEMVHTKANDSVIQDPATKDEFQGGEWGDINYIGANLQPEVYGPYKIPGLHCPDVPAIYYSRSVEGDTGSVNHRYTYSPVPLTSSTLYGDDDDYVDYDVFVPCQRDVQDGLYHLLNAFPVAYKRTEEDGKVIFTAFHSSSEEYGINGQGKQGYGTDVYFDRHKPTRDEERNGLIATFSYAPVKTGDDNQTIIQNGFQTIKVQHTSDEIRYKLANERIPGTLDVEEDFRVSGSSHTFLDSFVSGSSHIKNNLYVTKSVFIRDDTEIYGSLRVSQNIFVTKSVIASGNLNVAGTASIADEMYVGKNITCSANIRCQNLNTNEDLSVGRNFIVSGNRAYFLGDVEIKGRLVVSGGIYGNLHYYGYNSLSNPNYAQAYERFGTQDTGSTLAVGESGSQSDVRLKLNRQPIYDAINKLSCMTGYEFDWASEAEKEGRDVGVVAQEVQNVYPFAVGEGKDGYLRVDYTKLVPLLIEAVKSLSQEVEWLRSRIH